MSIPDNKTEEFLTIPEVMKILRVSETAVREWLGTGKLKGVQVGGWLWRVKREDFEEFVNTDKIKESPNGKS